ncbi:MAG: threonine aldolase [Cyclobacteriaceae bacterium]|nr:MAG: threonine aldolase [Cyclobacteriaceae bacterium]
MAWYHINHPESVASPGLLVYPDRIKSNIQEMLRVAGNADRLRPHVKTYKCREIVALQMAAGIKKFKCATIAEAEMLALCGVGDILLAYQPAGPNANRYVDLMQEFPDIVFSALVDNIATAQTINQLASDKQIRIGLFIDLDVGMHRTGVQPGPEFLELKEYLQNSSNLIFRGLHIYDGHIRNFEIEDRKRVVAEAFDSLASMIEADNDIEIVAGGSPTFPVHALNPRFNLSPGTCLLWDQGYSQGFPDQRFLHAAILICRVISMPAKNMLCLDLGHKAVASEMPHPRVYFPELDQVEFISQSEEHLVIRLKETSGFNIGDVVYAIPMHICPTTALHQEMVVIEEGNVVDRWKVFARDRRITF